jgi:hypothetical protein
MSDEKFHFEIPISNIRTQKYDKTGGGKSVNRINPSEHGRKLKEQTSTLIKNEISKKDFLYTSDLYLQIVTPEEVSLKSQQLKIEELGFEVLSYSNSNKSIGTARIKKDKLASFEERLDNYIETQDNKGKTYFSPIEELCSIPIESKIKTDFDINSSEIVEITINLFHALAPKERLAINGALLNELKQVSERVNYRSFSNGITSIECKL